MICRGSVAEIATRADTEDTSLDVGAATVGVISSQDRHARAGFQKIIAGIQFGKK